MTFVLHIHNGVPYRKGMYVYMCVVFHACVDACIVCVSICLYNRIFELVCIFTPLLNQSPWYALLHKHAHTHTHTHTPIPTHALQYILFHPSHTCTRPMKTCTYNIIFPTYFVGECPLMYSSLTTQHHLG